MDLIKSITTDTSLFLKYRYEDQGENIGINEFYRVLSIILAICIHPVRDIRRHWSDDGHFKNEWIKETMSQTAFLQYFYNLRYCDKRTNQQHQPQQIDNNQDDEEELHQYLPKSQKYDKKYGIISAQERVEMLIAKFQALWLLAYQKYFPSADKYMYTVDESLQFFSGQYKHLVRNDKKPAGLGLEYKMIVNTLHRYLCALELQNKDQQISIINYYQYLSTELRNQAIKLRMKFNTKHGLNIGLYAARRLIRAHSVQPVKNRNLESVQHVKNPECIAQNATPFIANNVSKSIYKILPSILIYDWTQYLIFINVNKSLFISNKMPHSTNDEKVDVFKCKML
ncbi:PiggyBac_transposable element-derived protein [Hexamita inflata]|uniref:PiggyBac transposable element-derived protein n=1 Tax=Hexamita inflata TaxID=28002 RepID=A0AA86PA54_9EUKA|nr:PiggyBac transposable element-derived protein [Hexamita inflata]